jgi:hypothetical protein
MNKIETPYKFNINVYNSNILTCINTRDEHDQCDILVQPIIMKTVDLVQVSLFVNKKKPKVTKLFNHLIIYNFF